MGNRPELLGKSPRLLMSLAVCLARAFHHCNRTVVLTLCTGLDNQEAHSFQPPQSFDRP